MSIVKNILKQITPPFIQSLFKRLRLSIQFNKGYSNLDEEKIIRKYLDLQQVSNKFCIDIAASDGINMSNTYSLYKEGWGGIAVELDPIKFALLSERYKVFEDVNLVKTRVVPENVVNILKACECPKDPAFLSFDIDGYDYFVLEAMLKEFRPQLICMEINEKIPPPIAFSVKYDPTHYWKWDYFFGQSISKSYELCKLYNYDIVELHYNNLFIVPHELNKQNALSPEEAYNIGYRNKPDRKEKFPWNSELEVLQTMSKEDALIFLHSLFKPYEGKYVME